MAKSPYPLQWPDGWPRSRYRERSKFDLGRGFNSARDGALHQLDMMRASHVVITSNLPINSKGVPYTSAQGNISDPGIAVWWVKKGHEHVIACDRWLSATENMRAIEKSLEAMRGLDRWGANEIVERAFAGFAALPPGTPPGGVKRPWREVFGMTTLPGDGTVEQLSRAKARHRELIRKHHPDVGGDHEIAAELNAALAEAERELGARP